VVHLSEKHSDNMVILAEHYASLKNTYDKQPNFDKILKADSIEREKAKKEGGIRFYDEIKEFDEMHFFNMIKNQNLNQNMTQNLNKKDKDIKITKPIMKLSTKDKFENNNK